jgi:lysophospholipase L1-like esterase
MTAGEVVSEGSVGRTLSVPGQMPLKIDDAASYPTQLRNSLTGRYTGQAGAIVVANSGAPGELTADGLRRLPTVIDGGAYDALLLMEGVNDFPDYQTALGNMRSMVQYGKRRSVRVYLATVPPQDQFHTTCTPNRARNEAFVAPYNDGIRNIAAAENVTLADVFTAFHGDTTTLIDCDGLHPTPAGYKVIADTFFKAIQNTLEVAPPNPTALPTPTTLRIAPARRSR